MEILNTIQGAEITELTTLGVNMSLMFLIGLILYIGGLAIGEHVLAVIGLPMLLIVFFVAIVFNVPLSHGTGKYNPTKYEVRITDPNYVIDAQKYRVIDKRGQIITLEEVKQ
jgi:uncharacterized membrane protein